MPTPEGAVAPHETAGLAASAPAQPAAGRGEDAALVARLEQGDPAAEAELVRRFEGPLRTLFLARVRDVEASRDLVQEALLAALRAIREGRLADPGKLPAFIAGIGRNLAGKHLRSLRSAPLSLDGLPEPPCAPPPGGPEETERIDLVRRALAELAPGERQVLALTWLEGLTPRAISDRLGLSGEVVRARKSRALKKVAEFVAARSRIRSPGDESVEGER